MSRHKKISSEQKARIISRRKRGQSIHVIAQQEHVGRATVRGILFEHNPQSGRSFYSENLIGVDQMSDLDACIAAKQDVTPEEEADLNDKVSKIARQIRIQNAIQEGLIVPEDFDSEE